MWTFAVIILFFNGLLFWQFGHMASSSVLATIGLIVSGLFSLGLVQILVTTPSTYSSIGSDGEVTFTWRYITHCEHKVFHPSALAKPTVVERIDSDGDSNWSTQLVLPDGTVFIIAEYGTWTSSGRNEKIRKRCEAACVMFIEDLSRAASA